MRESSSTYCLGKSRTLRIPELTSAIAGWWYGSLTIIAPLSLNASAKPTTYAHCGDGGKAGMPGNGSTIAPGGSLGSRRGSSLPIGGLSHVVRWECGGSFIATIVPPLPCAEPPEADGEV